MKKKFYCLLFKDEKKYGIPMSPQGFDTLFGQEVKPVIIPDGCTFTIFDGEFAPFHNSNTRAHFVNEELKSYQGFSSSKLSIRVPPHHHSQQPMGRQTILLASFH